MSNVGMKVNENNKPNFNSNLALRTKTLKYQLECLHQYTRHSLKYGTDIG